MNSSPRTTAQRAFDDSTCEWKRWQPAECRGRVAALRRIAAELDVEDSRFGLLRKIVKRGEKQE